MKSTQSDAGTNQHYVPQFLLRNFVNDCSKRLHVFNKAKVAAFTKSPKRSAADWGFYDFESSGQPESFDPFMTTVENLAAPIIERILQNASIGGLTSADRCGLSFFAAVQFLRVPSVRQRIQSFNSAFRKELANRNIIPGNLVPEMDANEVKRASIAEIQKSAKRLAKCLFERVWTLHRAPGDKLFYISDHPITSFNNSRPGDRLFVIDDPDFEVYFPISKQYSICFQAPTFKNLIDQVLAGVAVRTRIFGGAPVDLTEVEPIVRAMATGEPDDLLPENVEHQNSLQVIFSSQYVFSSDGEFELVWSMLKRNPKLCDLPAIIVY